MSNAKPQQANSAKLHYHAPCALDQKLQFLLPLWDDENAYCACFKVHEFCFAFFAVFSHSFLFPFHLFFSLLFGWISMVCVCIVLSVFKLLGINNVVFAFILIIIVLCTQAIKLYTVFLLVFYLLIQKVFFSVWKLSGRLCVSSIETINLIIYRNKTWKTTFCVLLMLWLFVATAIAYEHNCCRID